MCCVQEGVCLCKLDHSLAHALRYFYFIHPPTFSRPIQSESIHFCVGSFVCVCVLVHVSPCVVFPVLFCCRGLLSFSVVVEFVFFFFLFARSFFLPFFRHFQLFIRVNKNLSLVWIPFNFQFLYFISPVLFVCVIAFFFFFYVFIIIRVHVRVYVWFCKCKHARAQHSTDGTRKTYRIQIDSTGCACLCSVSSTTRFSKHIFPWHADWITKCFYGCRYMRFIVDKMCFFLPPSSSSSSNIAMHILTSARALVEL